ncbi:hypothetical protein CGLO_10793 [Colletotrichum gloeosporioides Cg-14]|uniref:Uncharacterized protein n=1 Tax=Colletotrichum gloeosporioides (strain Cg-14) TaxID=1237896 RepID=T0K9V4_COLGC|nr:hypothetical protein CGLO_10793 [Colletotrichum gloeosporioides Cg-14]
MTVAVAGHLAIEVVVFVAIVVDVVRMANGAPRRKLSRFAKDRASCLRCASTGIAPRPSGPLGIWTFATHVGMSIDFSVPSTKPISPPVESH